MATTLRGNQKHPKKRAFSGTPQLPAALKGIVIKDNKDNFVDNSRQFSEFFLTTTTTTCVNNLRGNQLPAALKESHVSVNKYINPLKRMQSAALVSVVSDEL